MLRKLLICIIFMVVVAILFNLLYAILIEAGLTPSVIYSLLSGFIIGQWVGRLWDKL